MPHRSTFDGRPRLLFITVLHFTLNAYYFVGRTDVHELILLSTATQVITPGLLAITSMSQHLVANIMLRRPLPLDLLTSLMLEVDTRLGAPLNPSHVILSGTINILLLHLPDIALGSLAADAVDVRSTHPTARRVRLGPFGGGYSPHHYYTSGLRLLFDPQIRDAYLEVAVNTSATEILIPNKPTLWYTRYKTLGRRDNDREPRIHIRENPAVALRLTRPPDKATLRAKCNQRRVEDFGFALTFATCVPAQGRPHLFGFHFSGPRVPTEEGFFELWRGFADVHYLSYNGVRRMRASPLGQDAAFPVQLPRTEQLFREMLGCMLNAVSFYRPDRRTAPGVPLRLAISSVVRVAGLDSATGFDENVVTDANIDADTDPDIEAGSAGNSTFVEATEWRVAVSNLHRGVLIAAWVAYALSVASSVLFAVSPRLVGPELVQWLGLGFSAEFAKNISPLPRFRAEQERRLKGEHEQEKDGVQMSLTERMVEAMKCDWVTLRRDEGLSFRRWQPDDDDEG